MKTVTKNAFHEKLHIEGEEITLNGPPSFLTGNIYITNKDSDTLFIRELPLFTKERKQISTQQDSFKLLTSLRAGEERMHMITHQLAPGTPPGVYESTIQVGGKEKRLKMIVQENIEIDINPLSLHFNGINPGKSYTAELSFTNTGNVAFKIPEVKHGSILDEDFLCRATAMAIRNKGAEGFTAMMDELTKKIQSEMADWVAVELSEGGKTVEPGVRLPLHFKVTLPKNVDASRDYYGDVRVWTKTISYRIKS